MNKFSLGTTLHRQLTQSKSCTYWWCHWDPTPDCGYSSVPLMQWEVNQGVQKTAQAEHSTIHLTPNVACLSDATACEQQRSPLWWNASLQKAAARPTVPWPNPAHIRVLWSFRFFFFHASVSGRWWPHTYGFLALWQGLDLNSSVYAIKCASATEQKLHHTDLPITSALTWRDRLFWHRLKGLI